MSLAEKKVPPANAEARVPASPGVALGQVLLMAALFAAVVLPPIRLGLMETFAANDMAVYHLPQINQFMERPWNWIDYDATSATTPLYHVLLAVVADMLGYTTVDATTIELRVVNAAVGFAAIGATWLILYRLSRNPYAATALTLPLAASSYVISSSIWIVTDNAALLAYVLLLAAVLFRPRAPALGSAAAVAMVACRQIYLPVAGVLLLPALAAPRGWLLVRRGLAALAPVAVVGVYVASWGGLTPPAFQDVNSAAFNPAVPLHALALTGLFLPVYAVAVALPATRFSRTGHIALSLAAASLALALWLAGPSTYSAEEGRWGSVLWSLARLSPAVDGHALIVLPLAFLGALALLWMGLHSRRQAYLPVELAMLVLYFMAYSVQYLAWQRYIEPVILLTYAVFVARLRPSLARYLPPALFGIFFGALAMGKIYGAL